MPDVKVIRPVGRPTIMSQALTGWAVDVGGWIINWMEENNRIATSVSINSLVVQSTRNPDTVTLFGSQGVAWALQGRKPGAFPNITAIKQWIIDKPIRFNPSEITLDSLTYLIGRKIADKGTNEPKLRPQNLQLVINQLGRKHLTTLGDELAKNMAAAIVDAWTIREPKKESFPSTKLFGTTNN